jgi:PEP-CTERM putative exosortase interaction domain
MNTTLSRSLTLIFALVALTITAGASTIFTLDIDHCSGSGGCGTSPFGTVELRNVYDFNTQLIIPNLVGTSRINWNPGCSGGNCGGSDTPEPQTFILLGTGLIGMSFFLKKKAKLQ